MEVILWAGKRIAIIYRCGKNTIGMRYVGMQTRIGIIEMRNLFNANLMNRRMINYKSQKVVKWIRVKKQEGFT
jgi:hypothetical protein